MNDFKLSRRSFVKALGALGLAATLPSVALHGKPAQLPVAETIDDAVIDLPISKETPFAWVSLNGERIIATRIDISVKNTFDDFDFLRSPFSPDFPSTRCEVNFGSEFGCSSTVQNHMHRGAPVNFEISVPGYGTMFTGKAYIVEIQEGLGESGLFTSVHMNSVGHLGMRLS